MPSFDRSNASDRRNARSSRARSAYHAGAAYLTMAFAWSAVVGCSSDDSTASVQSGATHDAEPDTSSRAAAAPEAGPEGSAGAAGRGAESAGAAGSGGIDASSCGAAAECGDAAREAGEGGSAGAANVHPLDGGVDGDMADRESSDVQAERDAATLDGAEAEVVREAEVDAPAQPLNLQEGAVRLSCRDDGIDGGAPWTDLVRVPDLGWCTYSRSMRSLSLELFSSSSTAIASISMNELDGPGGYTTSDGALPTSIALTGGEPTGAEWSTPVSSAATVSSPPHPCTIVVDHDFDRLDAGASRGRIQLDVSCPVLGGAGTGAIACTVEPSTFRIALSSCELTP